MWGCVKVVSEIGQLLEFAALVGWGRRYKKTEAGLFLFHVNRRLAEEHSPQERRALSARI